MEERLREMVRAKYEDRLIGLEETVIGATQGTLGHLAEDAQDQAVTYIREMVPRIVNWQVEQMFERVVEPVVKGVRSRG